ncbi:MAG: ester cyclase [Acidobacteriota bacterium]|jgi:predicted ester cyclase
MTHRDIAQFFTRRDKDWLDHNVDALTDGHAEDGEILSPLFGNIRGYSAIHKSYAEFYEIFPDAKYDTEDLLIDGDRAAQFVKMTGTQEQNFCGFSSEGKQFQFQLASLFFFSDMKIIREIRIYDFTGMLLQIGALKAKPAF